MQVVVFETEKIRNALYAVRPFSKAEFDFHPDTENIDSVQIEVNGTTQKARLSYRILREGSISFRMGQTGVSYKTLFAPYLETANEITIEDPYIRTSWQVKNLVEFITMLIESRNVEGLKINVVTNEEDEKLPELIDRLDDIKDDLVAYGIEFAYSFREFHDRTIKTDTGWTITLGRGLDIFEKFSPYSVEAMRQDRRKCKDFMVTYLRNHQ